MTARDIPAVDRLLKRAFQAHRSPIIELVEAQTHDPFCVLVGTILSARTKDQCTAGAVRRLFAAGAGDVFTPADLDRLTQAEIEKLIFPVGFFRDKARHLKALPGVLREKFGGVLPQTVEELCELPGVGRKTANLRRRPRPPHLEPPRARPDEDAVRDGDGPAADPAGEVLEDVELAPRLVRSDPLRAAWSALCGLSPRTLLPRQACRLGRSCCPGHS